MQTLPAGKAIVDAADLWRRSGLGYGKHVADFGCGSLGHFAFSASPIVGEDGRVFAVDIDLSALSCVAQNAGLFKRTNIHPLMADVERYGSVPLKDGSLDLIGLAHMASRLRGTQLAQEAARVLVPHGRVLLLDWKGGAPFVSTPSSLENEALALCEKVGLRPEARLPASRYHFAWVLQKV